MTGRIVGIASLAIVAASSVASAALVTFDFQDDTKNAAVTSPNVSAAITSLGGSASDYALADHGIQTGSGNKFLSFSGIWKAYQNEHYITLNVTVASGYKMDLNSFGYDMLAGGGTTGGWSSAAFCSADGNAWPGLAVVNDTTSGWGGGATPVVASLAASTFQNLTGTVSFRISPFKTHGNDIWGQWQGVDNIVIDGTVAAVPEPTLLMSVLGLGSLLSLKRRRA